jgi:hypothetical protein
MFNPYHEWLGLPQDPPTFYQLLGLDSAGATPQAVDEKALERAARVRKYQIGPRAQECARLLNEIALARATLRDPARRQEYDARLAPQVGEASRPDVREASPALMSTPVAPAPPPAPTVLDVPTALPRPPGLLPPGPAPEEGPPAWADPALFAYLVLLLGGAALAFWLTGALLLATDAAARTGADQPAAAGGRP